MEERPDSLTRSLSKGPLPDPAVTMTLLRRAKGGDDRALHDLIERYADRIRRIARIQRGSALLRSVCESTDLVQETHLAAWADLKNHEFESPGALLRWLSTILINKAHDLHEHHTAQKRDVRRNTRIQDESDSGEFGTIAASKAPDPLEKAAESEFEELLDGAVMELPEDQRRVVVLKDYCDDDWETIADQMGRNVGAAKMLHQRAKITLRRVLKTKYPHIEP